MVGRIVGAGPAARRISAARRLLFFLGLLLFFQLADEDGVQGFFSAARLSSVWLCAGAVGGVSGNVLYRLSGAGRLFGRLRWKFRAAIWGSWRS